MIKVGDKIGTRKVVEILSTTYVIVCDDLTKFIGYEIKTRIKKNDLERMI